MTMITAASRSQILQAIRPHIRRAISKIASPRLVCALFIAVALCGPAIAAETFRDGLRAYNVNDYSTAYSIWLRLAQQEDANSQSSLAYLYYEGLGLRQDSEAAAKWYYKAATQGEPTAQSFLCEMHMRGDGVERNLELALMWCELSIEGGATRGVNLRERVMEQMTTHQRDAAWDLVAKLRQEYVKYPNKVGSRPSS